MKKYEKPIVLFKYFSFQDALNASNVNDHTDDWFNDEWEGTIV
jgi:hypothetical protein